MPGTTLTWSPTRSSSRRCEEPPTPTSKGRRRRSSGLPGQAAAGGSQPNARSFPSLKVPFVQVSVPNYALTDIIPGLGQPRVRCFPPSAFKAVCILLEIIYLAAIWSKSYRHGRVLMATIALASCVVAMSPEKQQQLCSRRAPVGGTAPAQDTLTAVGF